MTGIQQEINCSPVITVMKIWTYILLMEERESTETAVNIQHANCS